MCISQIGGDSIALQVPTMSDEMQSPPLLLLRPKRTEPRTDTTDRYYRVAAWRGGTLHLYHEPYTADDRRLERRRVDAIILAVCGQCDVTLTGLLGPSRKKEDVEARRVLVLVLRQFKYNRHIIARIAQRDMTTLLVNKMSDRRARIAAAHPEDEAARTERIHAAALGALDDARQAINDFDKDPLRGGTDMAEADAIVLRVELGAALLNLGMRGRADVLTYVCDVLLRSAKRKDSVSAVRGLWLVASTPWVRVTVFTHLRKQQCARYEALVLSHIRHMGWRI